MRTKVHYVRRGCLALCGREASGHLVSQDGKGVTCWHCLRVLRRTRECQPGWAWFRKIGEPWTFQLLDMIK